MKKKPYLAIPMFLVLFLSSCEKNNYHWQNSPNYFTFTESEITVEVGELTTSFDIKARLSKADSNERLAWIRVDKELSTAVEGKHYKLPEINMELGYEYDKENLIIYSFPANSIAEKSAKITIVPENITSELSLVFKTESDYGHIDDGNHIYSVTVTLMPVE